MYLYTPMGNCLKTEEYAQVVHSLEIKNIELDEKYKILEEKLHDTETTYKELFSLQKKQGYAVHLLETKNNEKYKTLEEKLQDMETNYKEMFSLQKKQGYAVHLLETKNNEKYKTLEEKLQDTETTCKELFSLQEKQGHYNFDRQKLLITPSDRWTDPLNADCRLSLQRNKFSYGNPGYDVSYSTDKIWSEHPWCNCFHCILISKTFDNFSMYQQYNSGRSNNNLKQFCPLDSNCTCLSQEHRMYYVHNSLELGYTRDRDLELSPVNLSIVQSMTGRTSKENSIAVMKWGKLGFIVNIKKDEYSYRFPGEENQQMATKDDLYYTNDYKTILGKVYP